MTGGFTVRALGVVLCGAVVLAARGQAEERKLVIDGSTTVGPLAKAFRDYFKEAYPDVAITVGESGSGIGAKSLINGTCDVADMSRFMKPSEFKAAVDNGVTPVAHVVALDGIAIITHPANPVRELTTAQVRDIYMGKVRNWREVGGPDREIVKISRDTNSGTYETFEERVMNQEKIAADTEYVGSNGAVRQRVASTPAAIGYVGLGFSETGVVALAIDGVKPTLETVASGLYPIARPLFMFTNGFPELGTPLHRFVTLHLTPKGQEIVERLGFVPVTRYETAKR